MKKLTTVALAGALALGGLAGVASFDAKPASAAEKSVVQAAQNPYDDWGITNTSTLYEFIPDLPDYYKSKLSSSYKTGNWFTIIGPYYNALGPNDQVKIFRVSDDGKGELSRYKTIDWHNESALPDKAIWDTQITDAYQPGTYVAVAYLYGQHYKTDFFTINK